MRVGIVGSGPAALMVADQVSAAGHAVQLFEKRKSLGRKLLIAGSSGLNITNALLPDEFIRHYSGPRDRWKATLCEFSPQDWIAFIEELGIQTFKGTSGRYFVEEMKAAGLLKNWRSRLESQGVKFQVERECVDFS